MKAPILTDFQHLPPENNSIGTMDAQSMFSIILRLSRLVYDTMVLAVALSYLQVGGRTPTVL